MAKKKTSYKNEIVLTEEFFEIRLTCDTNTIDVFTLIKYLTKLITWFKASIKRSIKILM